MTDYVWYPVTGDGQTAATPYVWNGGTINWNTSNFWAQGDALIFGTQPVVAGAIPGSGGGSGAGMSQGPGLDNVGIVAGEISPFLFQFYSPNPSKGDPYIASN